MPRSPANETSLEFGRGRGAAFPTPGFQGDVQGFAAAKFQDPIPAGDLSKKTFHISGSWIQDQDGSRPPIPMAVLAFHATRSNVALVARSTSTIGGTSKGIIDLEGRPVFDVFAGDSLQMDEDGNSRVVLEALLSSTRFCAASRLIQGA